MNEVPALYTGRFSDKRLAKHPEYGKVRISRGHPRWNVGYTPLVCEPLAPSRWLLNQYREDKAGYREHYLAQMNQLGIDRVNTLLRDLATVEDHPAGLVLLCFEDLSKPDKWCHRRLFSEWYEAQTGITIPEWTDGSGTTQLFML